MNLYETAAETVRCFACGAPWHPATGGLHRVEKSGREVPFCGPCERDLVQFVKYQTSRKEKANPNAVRAGAKARRVGMHERVAALRALVEGGFRPGTRRKWSTGYFVKQRDGSWTPEPVRKTPSAGRPEGVPVEPSTATTAPSAPVHGPMGVLAAVDEAEKSGASTATKLHLIRDTAVKCGMSLDKVLVSDEVKKFEVNGKTYTTAGIARVSTTKEIVIYDNVAQDIPEIVSHEAGHIDFQRALDTIQAERDEVSKASQTEPDFWTDDVRKAAPDEIRNSDDPDAMSNYIEQHASMRVSGEPTAKGRKRFPALAVLWDSGTETHAGFEKLAQEDGVTTYSEDWWKEWETERDRPMAERKGIKSDTPLHETYAEITMLLATTAQPLAKIAKPAWRKYYRAMQQIAGVKPKDRPKLLSPADVAAQRAKLKKQQAFAKLEKEKQAVLKVQYAADDKVKAAIDADFAAGRISAAQEAERYRLSAQAALDAYEKVIADFKRRALEIE